MENIKKYRPEWIEPEAMSTIGYYLVSDKDGYLEYRNNGKVVYNKDYNKFPAQKGMRIVYINCTYKPDDNVVYMGVKEDGGTRTSFGGVVDSAVFIEKILISLR